MNQQMDLEGPAHERGMNPEQLAAIRHGAGPLKLLAVAGSGKTRALVNRIARMVLDGVAPESILAVTFSRAGADEMNKRLKQLGIAEARVGTWHSLCLQVIKEDRTEWSEWMVDEKDQAKYVLREVLGHKHLDWKKADLGHVRSYIGICKARLVAPESEESMDLARSRFPRFDAQKAYDAFGLYQRLVEERGLLTFDDFLVYVHRHLSSDEAARAKWAARWDHLLVDETQDNNPAQEAVQELLARDHRNILVVGDVAQSIFAFRGSDPAILHTFEERWPGCRTIVMHRNYRSGRSIIDVANKVIGPAKIRIPVDMSAERGTEGTVRVAVHSDWDAEGEAFAGWVYELLSSGQPLSSIAALYRLNAQSRAIEEALLKKRVPYVVVGGQSFYERKEVKDLLGYLRVASGRDPEGDACRRCINAPFRYLGAAFVDRVMAGEGRDWVKRATEAAAQPGVQGRQRQSVADWAAIVRRVAEGMAQEKPEGPAALLKDVVHATGYVQWIASDQGEESVENSHQANVHEMLRIAERFDTAEELLDYVDEMARASRRKEKGGDRVLLMTIHKSKGLEYPHVWVAGCNEGVLPHAKGDLEEERRLMYVAVTRARDDLVLSYVQNMSRRDGVKDAQPSQFLVRAGLDLETRVSSHGEEGDS